MKVCPYCAEELADDMVLCAQCGRDTTDQPEWSLNPQSAAKPSAEQIVRTSEQRAAQPAGGRKGANRLAVASFVAAMAVGILGAAAGIPPGLAVASFVVVIGLGVRAAQETRAAGGSEGGFGFAVAAVVLSVVGVIGYGRQLIG